MIRFDVPCKEVIRDLGEHLGFIPNSSYSVEPQAAVESITRFRSEERSRLFSVDVVWIDSLIPYGMPKHHWASQILSDVAVAWEVDSTYDLKRIRTSIDNLATLNPRLGIELLLIGGNKGSIKGFDTRFKTAIQAAKTKKARIIVIHDLIFSQLYFKVKGNHPRPLYNAYLETGRKPELSTMLQQKWRELLKKTETEAEFEQGLEEELLNKL